MVECAHMDLLKKAAAILRIAHPDLARNIGAAIDNLEMAKDALTAVFHITEECGATIHPATTDAIITLADELNVPRSLIPTERKVMFGEPLSDDD